MMLRCFLVLDLSAALLAGASGNYCAYEVRVNTPSGKPFAKTPVGIVDGGIQIGSATTDVRGVARFCDAPVHKVDIVVGAVGEGLVFIKGVKPTWPTIRRVLVIRDDSHWDEWVFPDACQVLLRIQDDLGRPISGAWLDGQSSGILDSIERSDGIGRLFQRLNSGGSVEGLITKQGYTSQRVSAKCIQGNEKDIELKFVLKPQ